MKTEEELLNQIEILCSPVCNAAELTEEEYALVRRQGLGASDASVYLGLQTKWRNETDLIANKLATVWTDEEKDVGRKPAVRKGKDLEPLILQKFQNILQIPCIKPAYMYKLKEFEYLTINFDGVADAAGDTVPVEAKFTTVYGDKYWNYSRILDLALAESGPDFTKVSIAAHCDEAFKHYGVPDYYYAQVQQQMLGLDSPYGFVVSLRDLDWGLYIFKVYKDEWLQKQIIIEGYRVWQRIMRQRTLLQS